MPTHDDLRFRAGDISLAATLTVPKGEVRLPWALLLPSWGPRTRDGEWDRVRHATWFADGQSDAPGPLERIADALAERGVASLRYDPRGCGESEGRWEESDLFTRIDDARDAIGAMRSRRELDLRRCAIVGHGEGGVIALSVAIGDPAIGAVGLVGVPARSLRDVMRRGASARARADVDREHQWVEALDRGLEELIERAERREELMRLRIGEEEVNLSLRGWEQGFHTPALALATMLHRNVVIAQGSADAWVDPEEANLLAGVLRDAGNEPTFQVLDGAGHDLREASDADIGRFADALVARMEPRELPPVLVAIEEMGGDG